MNGSLIQVGDKIISETTGETLKVREISRGFFTQPSLLFTYTNGEFSCVRKDAEIETAPRG